MEWVFPDRTIDLRLTEKIYSLRILMYNAVDF